MTSAQQERKMRHRRWVFGAAGALAAMLAVVGMAAGPTGAATTERVVTNRYSGLAISGYDPVAYFTEAGPRLGRGELEVRHAGATWRFRNEGNRAAFEADPDVFMPRFGGHDPISIARGGSAPGHPEVWVISEDRLYLFYTEAARDTFLTDPARAIEAAERHWPEVLRTLSP